MTTSVLFFSLGRTNDNKKWVSSVHVNSNKQKWGKKKRMKRKSYVIIYYVRIMTSDFIWMFYFELDSFLFFALLEKE